MKLSALLGPLLDAKVDHELIRQQIAAYEAEQSDALEQRRRTDAERQARKRDRDKSRDVTGSHSDRSLTGGAVRVEDKTSNLEIEPQKLERKKDTGAFEAFWSVYPEKVGKGAARKAFPVALSKAPLETLIAGVHRYIAAKPADRSYCHPSTWLNEERWDDVPAAPPVRGSPQKPLTPQAVAQQLLREMEEADARTETQIEGRGTAVVSISAYQRG